MISSCLVVTICVRPTVELNFQSPHPLGSRRAYDKADIPIEFKANPESLLNISTKVVDTLPLTNVYLWTTEDVCNWLVRCDYKAYENTFRINMVTGRKLLLIDASALCSMNIKNFDDIQGLTYGIRNLFYFEMATFIRSISFPYLQPYDLYKHFQTRSGYKQIKSTQLWCQFQILREKTDYRSHWDVLEHWMVRVRGKEYPELFSLLNNKLKF